MHPDDTGPDEQQAAIGAEAPGSAGKDVPAASAAATSTAASLPGAWATFGDIAPPAPASSAPEQSGDAPSTAVSTDAAAQPDEARAMPSAAHLPPEAAGAAEPVADAASSEAEVAQETQ